MQEKQSVTVDFLRTIISGQMTGRLRLPSVYKISISTTNEPGGWDSDLLDLRGQAISLSGDDARQFIAIKDQLRRKYCLEGAEDG
jgi:hypothetical protein